MIPWVRELRIGLAPAFLAVALLALGAVSARAARDAGAAHETLFLALWSAAALAPLAWLVVRPGGGTVARLVVAGAAIAVAMVTALLPRADGGRPAFVALALVAALFATAARRLRLPGERPVVTFAALALAAALVAHMHRLWLEPLGLATLVRLVALPALATAAAAIFERRGHRTGAALAFAALAGAPLVARESLATLAALATLAVLAASTTALARPARGLLAGAAALALVVGAFPWLRPAPLSTALAAALAPPTRSVELAPRALTLAAGRSRLELAVPDGPWSAVRLDSYLTNSAALACGTSLGTVEIFGVGAGPSDPPLLRGVLAVGRDSAEWAADRGDVAAALACAPPPAFRRWIPAEGRFLGRTSRARIHLPEPSAAARIVVERDPALPAELSFSIFHLALER